MKIEVHNKCSDFDSYRAARVKSLFNVESGAIDGYRVTVSRFDESGQTFSSPITAEK